MCTPFEAKQVCQTFLWCLKQVVFIAPYRVHVSTMWCLLDVLRNLLKEAQLEFGDIIMMMQLVT